MNRVRDICFNHKFMTHPKKYNQPIPKSPGLDLSDPQTLSGAKAVATRKNNAFRKMVEEKLPLFTEELFSAYTPVTPEAVIEKRRIERAGWEIKRKEIDAFQRECIRKYRAEVWQLVTNEKEFRFLMRMVVRLQGGDRSMRWYRVLNLVKRRREKTLSANADLVLAWLGQETEPVTHFEIWERRGDGLTPMQILHALMELMKFAYADTIEVVELPEKYTDLDDWKSKTAWTWQASVEI